MLEGEKIPGCNVCWTAENKTGYSDRQSKSSADWSAKFFDAKNRTIKNVTPTYVEVSFGNKCQMMCTYCSVENSSSIAREAKDYGNYLFMSDEDWIFTPLDEIFVDESEDHVYGKIFWEWFLKNQQQLEVLRFTGGEPLLSKWMDKFLDWLKHNPMSHADLAFNSNLSLSQAIISKFIQKLKDIPRSHYKNISFYTSLDGWGPGAELARFGINLELVEENIRRLRNEFPEATFRITATLNVLAFPEIKPLFEKVFELKKLSLFKDQFGITCYPLVIPAVLALNWSKKFFEVYYLECLEYLDTHMFSEAMPNGFLEYEREFFIKAVNFDSDSNLARSHADFYLYISQLKHRKKLTNLKLHPELEKASSEGLQFLMTSCLDELPYQLWAMAEPWIKNEKRQSEIRDYLYTSAVAGKIDYKYLLKIHTEYAKYILHPDWIEKWFQYPDSVSQAFKILFLMCLKQPDRYNPLMKAKIIECFANFNDELYDLALRYNRDLGLSWQPEEIERLRSLNADQEFFLSKLKL